MKRHTQRENPREPKRTDKYSRVIAAMEREPEREMLTLKSERERQRER